MFKRKEAVTPMKSIPQGPLSPSDIIQSRQAHGSNKLSARKQKSFLHKFLANLGDPVIRILLFALLLNLLFSFHGGTDWFETAGIGLAVFLATLISTLSEHYPNTIPTLSEPILSYCPPSSGIYFKRAKKIYCLPSVGFIDGAKKTCYSSV